MNSIIKRQIFLIIAVLNLGSVVYALYAQVYEHVQPCPLCIVQRVIIGLIGILSLLYAFHNPKNFVMRIYGIVVIVLSGFGIKVAAHHLWLMHLPADKQPVSCGMPINVLFDRLPLKEFLTMILRGDAECGKVNWHIFGLSAPTMVIILCSINVVLALIIVFRKR